MNTPISQLVDELIAADPSLKTHKAELTKLVETMRKTEPAWQPDEQFVQSLRTKLVSDTPSTIQSFFSSISMDNMKPFLFGGAGLVTVALVAVLITNVPGTPGTQLSQQAADNAMRTRFVRTSADAFGSLAALDFAGANPTANPAPGFAEEAVGFGGGGGISAGMMAADSKMIAPYPITRVRYEYVGGDISLPAADETPVYQYQFSSGDATQLARAVQGTNLDVFSLSSFDSLAVESVNLKEDKPNGYMVNLNLGLGTANINLNWERWPELQCDNGCDYTPLTPNDVPADETLIAKADAFLDERGIDRSLFGAPTVDDSWKRYQDRGGYVPTIMSVVYPLQLPEGTVHDMGGRPHGLSVSINIQQDIVDSVYNIAGGSYVGSAYDLESNVDRVLSFAADGGRPYRAWYNENEQDVNEVTYQLDTPEVIYIQHYPPEALVRSMRPRPAGDLYIPALRFPVRGQEQEGVYMPEYVIVPIVSDILDSYDDNNRGPVFPTEPVPLPAVLEASSDTPGGDPATSEGVEE